MQYALSSLVLILATLVIVVVSNWLAVKKAALMRFDLTATRAYTLSPQTRQILNDLDQPITVVTLFAESTSPSREVVRRMTQFSDLLDEYELRGRDKVEVEHIDPALDTEAYTDFAATLGEHYTDQLSPARQAIDDAMALFNPISTFAQEQAGRFSGAATRFPRLDPEQIQFLRDAGGVLGQMTTTLELESRRGEIEQLMTNALPDVEQATDLARQPLNAVKVGLLTPGIERLQAIADSPAARDEAKEFAAASLRTFRGLLERIDRVTQQLDAIDVADYAAARSNVLESNSVVVMTSDRLTTIRLSNVYTDPLVVEEGQAAPEQRFRGEEAVTGAIISLTLEQPPLIVFVNGTGRPATGPRGTHRHVAERLTNMNFQVEEWSPTGRQTQWGPMPAGPKPDPAEGQQRIWVFLPAPPTNPMQPQQNAAGAILQSLNEAIEADEPAMMFLGISPMARFGQVDPVAQTLAELGLDADTGKLIITDVIDKEGNRFPSRQHLITRFEADHPINRAMAGQTVNIQLALPLAVADGNDAADWTALLKTDADTWAEKDWDNQRQMPNRNEGEQAGPLAVALAGRTPDQRLIVIGDSDFATDQYILRTEMAITPEGLQAIERVQFAGNAELFVNGVYWLAGLDQLIATGARTQDVRRFDSISPGQMRAVWWIVMAGLPAACLLAGAAVWLVRRK